MLFPLDSILKVIQKVTKGLRKIVILLVVIFYSYMTIAVLAQVMGRYLFNYSISWAVESATFAQIGMVMLAAGLAMHKNLHVGVDVMVRKLPLSIARLVSLVILVTCLWFFWHAILGSFNLLAIGLIETSPSLRIPMFIPYLSLPIGLTYFALELVVAFLEKWKLFDGEMKTSEKT